MFLFNLLCYVWHFYIMVIVMVIILCNIAGLSVDGDSQGVERLYGALSAHMWPGMQLKSGDKINNPSLPEQEG